ncbi:MAG: hypothetical protein V4787_11555 [Pseudomonadota bacterium]
MSNDNEKDNPSQWAETHGDVRQAFGLPRQPLRVGNVLPLPPRDKLVSRDIMAKALADHEGLSVGWQCYMGAVDAVVSALRQEGFSVVRDSTGS